MPAIPVTLGTLVKTKVQQKFIEVGRDPLAGPRPFYYINFCEAIGQGIAIATPTVDFTTADTGTTGIPAVAGVGAGVGIIVDSNYMSQMMYTHIRENVLRHWQTTHDPWPPRKDNLGKWLKALTDGVAEAVQEHYATCWILTSAHPQVYLGTGVIDPNVGSRFSGVIDTKVATTIQGLGTFMRGIFWPELCEGLAKGYMEGIHNKSTGQVVITGDCSAGDGQVCGIPGVGVGLGVAT